MNAHALYCIVNFDFVLQITYYTDGGSIEDIEQYSSYAEGESLTLPVPAKDGYTFDGWYESESFDGEAVTAISATDTGDKVFYAKWTANTYTVTYNKDGGNIADEDSYTSYTYGEGLTLPTPAKEGYTFDGWYESESFDGDAVTAISAADTGDKEYWAKWTENAPEPEPEFIEPIGRFAEEVTIEKVTDEEGNISLVIIPKNSGDELPDAVTLFGAIYNAQEQLERVISIECMVQDGTIIVPVTEPILGAGETSYKLMLWTVSQEPVISAITNETGFFE